MTDDDIFIPILALLLLAKDTSKATGINFKSLVKQYLDLGKYEYQALDKESQLSIVDYIGKKFDVNINEEHY